MFAGHVTATEKLKHEALDEVCSAMREHKRLTGKSPTLWKADVDSAFRRVPVNADQRWCCGVAFKIFGEACRVAATFPPPSLRAPHIYAIAGVFLAT